MTSESEESQLIADSVVSLPRHALRELLSLGVCVRCILRLLGVQRQACTSLQVSVSFLSSVLGDLNNCEVEENGCSTDVHTVENQQLLCSICLGILQFSCKQEREIHIPVDEKSLIVEFTRSIGEVVESEGHQIDSFSLEVSIPEIVLEKENAVRLYMQKKFEFEEWFQEKFILGHFPVEDCLKLMITDSLETLLGVKSGVSSFRICLTYKHSLKPQICLEKNHVLKRRKTDGEWIKPCTSEVGVAMAFDEKFTKSPKQSKFPLEKVNEPCHVSIRCYRTPIYFTGRYLKFSRNVSQTRWIIDDERKGESSVEEIIGNEILPVCRGDSYKFHAAGREDIDVRMLGSGRPFLIEVVNPRYIPTPDIEEISNKIRRSEGGVIKTTNLKVVGNEAWTLMREGEAEKQKQYAALVWISRPLKDEDLQLVSVVKDMDILQKTPIRVLHRRSPLERKRVIHWMDIQRITGSCQYFLLHLCTQAGTYIKEFVHGDLGRTHPSIGSLLGCRAEILQLDVTDVKMDCFN